MIICFNLYGQSRSEIGKKVDFGFTTVLFGPYWYFFILLFFKGLKYGTGPVNHSSGLPSRFFYEQFLVGCREAA